MVYRRIRDLREDHDLKQRQLAEYLRCSQQTYSDYENGKVDVPTQVLIALAIGYETTTDYLLGLSDQRRTTGNRANRMFNPYGKRPSQNEDL